MWKYVLESANAHYSGYLSRLEIRSLPWRRIALDATLLFGILVASSWLALR